MKRHGVPALLFLLLLCAAVEVSCRAPAACAPAGPQGHAAYLRELLTDFESDWRVANQFAQSSFRSACERPENRHPVRSTCVARSPLRTQVEDPLGEMIDECTAVRLAEGFIANEGWAAEAAEKVGPYEFMDFERARCETLCPGKCGDGPLGSACEMQLRLARRNTVRPVASSVCSVHTPATAYLVAFEPLPGGRALYVAMSRCGTDARVQQDMGATHYPDGLPCYAVTIERARERPEWNLPSYEREAGSYGHVERPADAGHE